MVAICISLFSKKRSGEEFIQCFNNLVVRKRSPWIAIEFLWIFDKLTNFGWVKGFWDTPISPQFNKYSKAIFIMSMVYVPNCTASIFLFYNFTILMDFELSKYFARNVCVSISQIAIIVVLNVRATPQSNYQCKISLCETDTCAIDFELQYLIFIWIHLPQFYVVY